MAPRSKRLVWILLALLAAALLVYAFMPTPVAVDIASVARAPMQVTVDHEGKTRVKDRFVISSPVAGELERIELKEGDPVEAGQTVLARIHPSWPVLLDERTREEALARVRAAEASLDRADPEIRRVEAELDHARKQYARRKQLATDNAMSQQELEDSELAVKVSEAQLRSATAARQVAAFELEQARAALLSATASSTRPATFEIRSPITGQLLRIIQESRAPVTPGAQLLEVGDVTQIEAVIDVLSRDAVKVQPGAKVYLDRWGGEQPLIGAVRRVEPSGFTKISALGVEEQRVNVIVDLPLPQDAILGDYFRVDARIVVWDRTDVLQVPSGALFRQGEDWAVYRIEAGRATLRLIQVGRMNGPSAEVLEGLQAADQVILHPSDKIHHGARISPRPGPAD